MISNSHLDTESDLWLWFTYYNHGQGVNVCMCAPLRPTLCHPVDCVACQAPLSMGFFSGKNTGVGCHFFLQGESSRPRAQTHISCIGRQFLYHWSHQGSPKVLIPALKIPRPKPQILFPTVVLLTVCSTEPWDSEEMPNLWEEGVDICTWGILASYPPFSQETAAFIAVLHIRVWSEIWLRRGVCCRNICPIVCNSGPWVRSFLDQVV